MGAERVIAIEPDPRTRNILLRNLKLNKITHVAVLREALWNKSGERASIMLSSKSGLSSVMRKPTESVGQIEVRTATLDEIVRRQGLNRVDFVKIDVEGAELRVIEGCEELLAEFKPLLLVEVKGEKERLFKLMEERGYMVLGPYSYGENYFFVPIERVELLHIVT
ncbi:MAG: FkbM family methyltransferase [Nitrososphaerota archaeon]